MLLNQLPSLLAASRWTKVIFITTRRKYLLKNMRKPPTLKLFLSQILQITSKFQRIITYNLNLILSLKPESLSLILPKLHSLTHSQQELPALY